jgi:hypothetical protein
MTRNETSSVISPVYRVPVVARENPRHSLST